ncbi:MAG TPA: ATP-binding protein, partial [Holophagaceae bacterium]
MALRPSTLDDLGLIATLAWFSREFQSTYPHIQVDHAIEVEEAEVPDPLKTTIFRIVQEAMNNAAKHSQASRITLALRVVFGALQLVVADNGVGFKPGEPRRQDASGGFGLAFMRERAELFGGAFVVTSGVGVGTEVTAQWATAEIPTA